jgi:hypothetical protein
MTGSRSPNVVQYRPDTRQNRGTGQTKDQHETTRFTTRQVSELLSRVARCRVARVPPCGDGFSMAPTSPRRMFGVSSRRIRLTVDGFSVRKRAIAVMLPVVTSTMGIAVLAGRADGDPRFLWLFLIPVFWTVVLIRLRCPHCKHPVTKTSASAVGESWEYWTPFVPRHCACCGRRL